MKIKCKLTTECGGMLCFTKEQILTMILEAKEDNLDEDLVRFLKYLLDIHEGI